ncbi:MAG: hypothetical protein HY681_04415 [Chloroflexi bacterium]|nr:hypothetical protein [Chloroflexota bacterium]
MNLGDWLRNGWLTEHQSSAREIADLMAAVARDLADCRVPALSEDWRFNIAYNAALQAATAALAAEGFRAAREQHHFRIIQSLAFTIGADKDLVDLFDRFRRKRNFGTYERTGVVSEHEVEQMLELAQKLKGQVEEMLRERHPELIED